MSLRLNIKSTYVQLLLQDTKMQGQWEYINNILSFLYRPRSTINQEVVNKETLVAAVGLKTEHKMNPANDELLITVDWLLRRQLLLY